jgi:acyl-CoA thioesterase-1
MVHNRYHRIASECFLSLAALLFAAPSSSQEGTIVALGDSNTSGFGVGPQNAFPSQLQGTLHKRGRTAQVINAGIPGDTFGGMLARLDASVPQGTGQVIVQGGYNDVARGIPRETSFENLDAILSRLQARGVKTVVCGFFNKKYDAVGRRIAASHRAKFVPGGTCYDPHYVGPDGLHMSATGHAVVAGRLAGVLQPSSSRKIAQHGRHHRKLGTHNAKISPDKRHAS